MVKTTVEHLHLMFVSFYRLSSFSGGSIDFDQDIPMSKNSYQPILAYNRSKLCNLLFVKELQRRLRSDNVKCFAVHPGMAFTGLIRHSWMVKAAYYMLWPFTRTVVSDVWGTSLLRLPLPAEVALEHFSPHTIDLFMFPRRRAWPSMLYHETIDMDWLAGRSVTLLLQASVLCLLAHPGVIFWSIHPRSTMTWHQEDEKIFPRQAYRSQRRIDEWNNEQMNSWMRRARPRWLSRKRYSFVRKCRTVWSHCLSMFLGTSCRWCGVLCNTLWYARRWVLLLGLPGVTASQWGSGWTAGRTLVEAERSPVQYNRFCKLHPTLAKAVAQT